MLYLIRGIPGSGKSTLARKMLDAGLVDLVCEADDYFITPSGGYNFDPVGLPAAHAACKDKALQALQSGHNVAVSNTSTTSKEVRICQEMALKCGTGFTSIVVESRHNNSNIHFVPADKLEKMKQRFNLEL